MIGDSVKSKSRPTTIPWALSRVNQATEMPQDAGWIRRESMRTTRQSSKWLKGLFLGGALCAFGGFIGSAVYAVLHEWPRHTSALPLYARMVAGALICFGLTFGMTLVHTASTGGYYSGLARRQVTRKNDPIHFWTLLGSIGVLPLAIVVFGVWKFITA